MLPQLYGRRIFKVNCPSCGHSCEKLYVGSNGRVFCLKCTTYTQLRQRNGLPETVVALRAVLDVEMAYERVGYTLSAPPIGYAHSPNQREAWRRYRQNLSNAVDRLNQVLVARELNDLVINMPPVTE